MEKEKRELLKKKHREIKEKRLADRIKTILLLDDGYSYSDIERILLLPERTTRRNEKRYKKGGLDELLKIDCNGYEGKLTSKQEEELKQHMREHLMGSAKEIVTWIKDKWGIEYTPEGIVPLLHRLGFSYKKTKQVPAKANRNLQEEFLKKYEEIRKNMGNNDKLYFMDATHILHNSMLAYGWIETGEEKEIKTNPGRERININGVLDVQTKEIIVREDETINAQSTIELFKQIENETPDAESIFVIADNAKYHKARIVKDYLETSRIKLVFLPAYSPNLNLIERVWKFFKKKKVRGKYYEKLTEFRENIIKFFNNFDSYGGELKSLLTENFQLVGT